MAADAPSALPPEEMLEVPAARRYPPGERPEWPPREEPEQTQRERALNFTKPGQRVHGKLAIEIAMSFA